LYLCYAGKSGTILPFVPSTRLLPQHTELTDSLQMRVISLYSLYIDTVYYLATALRGNVVTLVCLVVTRTTWVSCDKTDDR